MKKLFQQIILPIVAAVAIGLAGWIGWNRLQPDDALQGFVSGNGRIVATEIDIATKLGGRVNDVFVSEGDFIKKGKILAQMQNDTLIAQQNEIRARLQQAISAVAGANAQVAMRESDVAAAQAVVVQRQVELENAQRRLKRTQNLVSKGSATRQQLDDVNAATRVAEAALSASKAQVKAAQAAVDAAKSQVLGAHFTVDAVKASLERIKTDISDSSLKAPRDGRIQYRIVQPAEVLAPGGKLLNMVDLSDVYMTFFLSEMIVGRVALDSEARIILDALPGYVIPARVSFVSSVAQFTPKTVETAIERQKLMFRVKVRIDSQLLKKHIKQVKTGLPGVAWLKLDSQRDWPARLALRVPE
ncbi:MAG: hemolysin D [Gammaproteobacteria bacterium]|nr:MAG: hemolysin D [Gammaproteobacteria bacterium]